ncbi:MAG: hypothetical protein Q8O19_01830, partial [Rectinemataceae bacterium]|nr:hypothetical protein [Rectinemataceae bacterium]
MRRHWFSGRLSFMPRFHFIRNLVLAAVSCLFVTACNSSADSYGSPDIPADATLPGMIITPPASGGPTYTAPSNTAKSRGTTSPSVVVTPVIWKRGGSGTFEGFGSNVGGGAGGTVVTVTNLNNSGAGSFREAVN